MNNSIYAVGGFDGATGLNSAECYNVITNCWKRISSMNTRRSSVGVASLSGYIFAVGGYDGSSRQCLNSVERYDPVLDEWKFVHEMKVRRSGAGVGKDRSKSRILMECSYYAASTFYFNCCNRIILLTNTD